MKVTLSKSVMLNWNPQNIDKVQVYQLTADVPSVELPEDVTKYVLEEYKDFIIEIIDTPKETPKSKEELVEEVKAKAEANKKEFETKKKQEENTPKTGVRLEDLARNA